MYCFSVQTRRARILINCFLSRDTGGSLKEGLVDRLLEREREREGDVKRRSSYSETRTSPAVGHNYLIRLIRVSERALSRDLFVSLLSFLSQTFVHLRVERRHTNVVVADVFMNDNARETKEICVCTTNASLAADSRSNSSPLVLSPSIFFFLSLSHCQPFCFFPLRRRTHVVPYPRMYVLRHGNTRERILTDWKPFTIDAHHATPTSSSSSNVSPFCIPRAFRW